MPCHPARARELVRRGKARWREYGLIRLTYPLPDAGLQSVVLGVDTGAVHVGLGATVFHNAQGQMRGEAVLAAQVTLRTDIKDRLDERRRLRRARRTRKSRYRAPWYSPILRVRRSMRVFNPDGTFLRRCSVGEGRELLKPDAGGRAKAVRGRGNSIRLLTKHQPPKPPALSRPRRGWIIVEDVEGREFGQLHAQWDAACGEPEDGLGSPDGGLLRHLLGLGTKQQEGVRKAVWVDEGRRLRLRSQSAAKMIRDRLGKAPATPPRKRGQIRYPKQWFTPSVRSKINAHARLVRLIARYVPVSEVRVEVASFDTQRLADPSIEGEGYQRGVNYGHANRKAFVLWRDKHTCVYCGCSGLGARGIPLEVDHVVPKSRGGKNLPDNLVAACHDCNISKANRSLDEWRPDLVRKVKAALVRGAQAMREASQITAMRLRIVEAVRAALPGVTVRETRGFVTKRNRLGAGLAKDHDMDAVAIASLGLPPKRVWRRLAGRYKAVGSRKRYSTQPYRAGTRCTCPVGRPARWVQPEEVNREVCGIRKNDLIRCRQPRMGRTFIGYAYKLQSNGTIGVSDGRQGARSLLGTVSAKAAVRLRHGGRLQWCVGRSQLQDDA